MLVVSEKEIKMLQAEWLIDWIGMLWTVEHIYCDCRAIYNILFVDCRMIEYAYCGL
jgi:hypothetical protein